MSYITAARALEPRRGAAVLLEVLRSEGVQYIFGNPGTTELAMIDALIDWPEIDYIWGLQETAVVAMADGYAQASGRPGFINLHTAGGLGHGMGALLNAQVSRTPLVVTAGQQDMRHALTDPLLSGDLVRIAGPAVKWAHEVTHPDQLPVALRRAFNDCVAAPSGSVFLSLPMNVMEGMTAVGIGERSTIDRASVAGSLETLSDTLAALTPGKIALIAGDEIYTSNASSETVLLAEALGAPVFGSSWPLHMPFPTSHPLWVGNLPSNASEIRAQLEQFDAVLVLGGQSLITYLYSEGSAVPPGCQLMQLSADVTSLGRTYSTTLSMVGDIKASLKVLLPLLEKKLARHREAITTLRVAAELRRSSRDATLKARARAELDAPITTPLVAAEQVMKAIGPHVAIIDEAPATTLHVRSFLHSSSTRQYSFIRGGVLGWGMPAAVGASLGLGREPVVSLVGDGAALYSPQTLWTAAREKLPVTFVVINNREYNVLKNYMKAQPHYLSVRANRFIAMDLVNPPIDFLALAVSMGLSARRVDRAADIASAVEDGIASGLPNLIEIPIVAS